MHYRVKPMSASGINIFVGDQSANAKMKFLLVRRDLTLVTTHLHHRLTL